MTVLVLGLRLPGSNLTEFDLEAEIVGLYPNILAYAFSFVVLGVYWIGHHNQFHYINRIDRVFLWVNILFLLTIGFVPFSTSLLGVYPFSPTAVRVYGANLAATGLALYGVWWYATSQYRLVEKDLDPHIVSLAKRRTIIGPVVSLLGILIGILLGIDVGYAFAVSPNSGLNFVIPWQQILEIVGLAYVLSMLATIGSARRAARIPPAEALRYSE